MSKDDTSPLANKPRPTPVCIEAGRDLRRLRDRAIRTGKAKIGGECEYCGRQLVTFPMPLGVLSTMHVADE